jgi:hypothetical protein
MGETADRSTYRQRGDTGPSLLKPKRNYAYHRAYSWGARQEYAL